jgi:hypothetical protein
MHRVRLSPGSDAPVTGRPQGRSTSRGFCAIVVALSLQNASPIV